MPALLVILMVLSSAQEPPRAPSVEGLRWLAGCWSSDAEGRRIEEHWMAPAGGTLLGMARIVAKGRTVEYEHLVIRAEGRDLLYVAKPSRQPEAAFRLTHHAADWRLLRFENPQHDFPTRIEYRLQDDRSLTATISGTPKGQPRTVTYSLKRGCEATAGSQ